MNKKFLMLTIENSSEQIDGFLDDYAFLIRGLLDYYKASLDLNALHWAKELQDIQDSLFWDTQHGAYFYSKENSPNVIVRLKEGILLYTQNLFYI